jgi:predicted secreted Zn-dependent protease
LQSARSFDGRVVRTGRQLVLKNSVAHTSYKLDDQKKAREYEGRHVKVTATMDADTSVLHVIDITESSHP